MSLVREWIAGFLGRHRARFNPSDWPEPGTEEYREYGLGWITAMATLEATEAEADEASRRLTADPPNWRREHIPKIVGMIRTMREVQGVASDTREDALRRSKDCEYCCGNGIVSVYHPTPDHERRIPVSVGAHCICPHGRWIRRRLSGQEETRDLLRRIPDFSEVLAGLSTWLAEMPGVLPFDGKPRVIRYEACLKR